MASPRRVLAVQPPDRVEARALRNLRIISEPQPSPEDAAVVRDGLARFNVAATRHTYYSPVAIFLKDERGAVLGGALGDVWEDGSISRSSG